VAIKKQIEEFKALRLSRKPGAKRSRK
jgi:hypothetical protein